MKVLAVIPAKVDSSRLPSNNWRYFIGVQTLVDRAIEDAVGAACVSEHVISADSSWPDATITRKRDCPDIADVARDALEQCGDDFDYVVTLQPTCPIRTPEMIDRLVHEVHARNCGGGVTVVPRVPWWWGVDGLRGGAPEGYKPSQECAPAWSEINAIQVASREAVLAGKRWSWPMCLMVMPSYAAVDIDEPRDWHQARRVYEPLTEALRYEQFDFVTVCGPASTVAHSHPDLKTFHRVEP